MGKIASLFGARRDVDARSTGQKSHLSEKFQGFACAFGSDLPLWKFSLNSLRTTGEKKRESRFVQISILFFSPLSCEDCSMKISREVNHFQTHKRSPEIFPTGAIFAPSIVRRHPVGHQIMRRFSPKFSNPIIFIFRPKILLTKCPYSHFSKSCDYDYYSRPIKRPIR